MGVDFYNCCVCNEIYSDCGEYGSCEGCGRSWCGRCDIETFWYDDDICCDLCFSTDPVELTQEKMLDYALEKLQMTRQQLQEEIKATRPEYTQPEHVYECKTDVDHECIGVACETLAEDYEDKTLKQYSTAIVRGQCCRAKYPTGKDKWCSSCLESSEKKIKE